MNKNLKKVISAIAALALSVTSFVAMAAYPDTEGHQHSSAIDELSALGIVEGFEDGTFHPDELVTRAQMAKMVVSALNVANAESNNVQKFNDVPADNWAAGWVATASDKGIINGTGNGNFDPNENVTYAQTMKMLVSAAGYATWAENQGGWPGGYLTYGNSIGVSNNISGVSNDTALTRAQCAQMIVNALEAPMLKQTGMTTNYQGNPVAELTQMDGTNSDKSPFTSMLTEYWDIYVLNGTVTSTGKDSSASKTDTVSYKVTKTKNYLGTPVGVTLEGNVTAAAFNGGNAISLLIGNSDADKYLNEYTKALVFADDYNDEELIYIESAGKNVKEVVDSSLIDAAKNYDPGSTTANPTIKVKKSASTNSTTTYKLDKSWSLVVNGVVVDETNKVTGLSNYIGLTTNPGADVTLIDNPSSGTTADGVYDVIAVDYYATAVVDSIVDKSDKTIVYFKDGTNGVTTLEILKDSDDKIYTFEKADENGVLTAIDVTELKENDVLSIAYDVNGTVKNSKFYDVIVSNKVKEGKVTASGTNSDGEDYFTVDGEDLVYVAGITPDIQTAGEYTIYLTANGRVAYTVKLAGSTNYAILDRAWTSNSGEIMVKLITKDGQKVDYELYDETSASDPDGKAATLKAVNSDTNWSNRNGTNGGLTLADRIVAYTITSNNKVKLLSRASGATGEIDVDVVPNETYTSSTNRLGSDKIDDATVVLDVVDWWSDGKSSVSLVSKESFVDAQKYDYVSAKDPDANASEALPYVFVTSGIGGWTVDTQMAVVSKTMTTSEDGQDRTLLSVYLNGELQEVVCEDTSVASGLTEGDVIIYMTNSEGYVDTIHQVMTGVNIKTANRYNYLKAIYNGTAISDEAQYPVGGTWDDHDNDPSTPNTWNGTAITYDNKAVKYVLAPVIDRTANGIVIGTVAYTADGTGVSDKSNTSAKAAWYMNEKGTALSYDDGVKVYTYTGENSNGYKVEVGAGAAVAKSMIVKPNANSTSYLDAAGKYITLGLEGEKEQANTIAFALMRVYDDDIVKEVLSITLPDDDVTATYAD